MPEITLFTGVTGATKVDPDQAHIKMVAKNQSVAIVKSAITHVSSLAQRAPVKSEILVFIPGKDLKRSIEHMAAGAKRHVVDGVTIVVLPDGKVAFIPAAYAHEDWAQPYLKAA